LVVQDRAEIGPSCCGGRTTGGGRYEFEHRHRLARPTEQDDKVTHTLGIGDRAAQAAPLD